MRYRDKSGTTRRSINAAKKHLSRIGELKRIVGSVNQSKYGLKSGVTFHGTNGSARFGGLSWGYGGEGPHGLIEVMILAGVPKHIAESITFDSKWNFTKGIKWEFINSTVPQTKFYDPVVIRVHM